MKIRLKLTLLFTALFSTLLLMFALTVYASFSNNREEEYYKRLKSQAVTKAELLLEAKVPPEVLQLIYKSSPNSLFEEEIAIYDENLKLLYHDSVELDKVKETPSMFQDILERSEIKFYTNNLQAVGLLHIHDGKKYIITAAAIDGYGFAILQKLKYRLIIAYIVMVGLTLILGRLFAKQSLNPVSKLVGKVAEITATSLDSRIVVGKGKDEITELGLTFNEMLDRLEKSFKAQKEFISNISHELRTPLSAIVAELELSQNKRRTVEEYRKIIGLTLSDSKKLVRLISDLLDLAKTSYDPSAISFRRVRIDEVLLDARSELIAKNKHYNVDLVFSDDFEQSEALTISGNEYLIKLAFVNIMENGCKFSPDNRSQVFIKMGQENSLILEFKDCGIGIEKEDLPRVFNFFFRGGNGKYAEGNGIGLSLTQNIVLLHKGSIDIQSKPKEGTSVNLEFDLS
ncbi:GHKL domain protein [Leptospira inadai serovar Lyme str. 10]|uniref:histidine kinase n=2 Tax=Leptospira inadai serovar Lyme TaxID=293084 RepID=V6HBL8_9LEPT|nr:ATP-binding protein [Leptospira inadai]EQA37076.1 GHKL domain protein [Leptospira inadai serovar Lyme str. 10]PNV76675.1 HAMP domain-containing protein [Leptospira inadai serovar Lyme]